MVQQLLLPEFALSNGDGSKRLFYELLADFNIITVRRGLEPSHGPATELLRSLLAENRGTEDVTVRGFDIRSTDHLCEDCDGPHIVFEGRDLVTICDSGGMIYKLFGVVGDDRFFVIGTDRQLIDAGSIRELDQFGMSPSLEAVSSPQDIARAPPEMEHASRKIA